MHVSAPRCFFLVVLLLLILRSPPSPPCFSTSAAAEDQRRCRERSSVGSAASTSPKHLMRNETRKRERGISENGEARSEEAAKTLLHSAELENPALLHCTKSRCMCGCVCVSTLHHMHICACLSHCLRMWNAALQCLSELIVRLPSEPVTVASSSAVVQQRGEIFKERRVPTILSSPLPLFGRFGAYSAPVPLPYSILSAHFRDDRIDSNPKLERTTLQPFEATDDTDVHAQHE